jgi:hypothetical protein
MNFLLTNYIYPIREKILLSKSLGIYLDNPRTDKEIEAVTKYIYQAYSTESAFQFSEEIISDGIEKFLGEYSKEDEYIDKFYTAHSQTKPYEILARMWIVARYDDEGQHDAITQEGERLKEEGQRGFFFMLEEDNPILKKSRELLDYCHLVSLLIHTAQDYYEGRSFILDTHEDWFQEIKPNHLLCVQVFMFMNFTAYRDVTEKDETRWLFLPAIREQLTGITKLIDEILNGNQKDKLLYIASLLKNAGYDIKEDKTKLVVLVSIIELLLTHNPDFNRFNVEDSINKQFQLKGATLIYLNDKSGDINQIKVRLKEIYGLRSSIAHGDFKAVTKYIENAKKKGEDFPISVIISELYIYLKAIITEYLRDNKFVDFLKDG